MLASSRQAARHRFSFDTTGNISIVYVRAYLNAGAEGFYDIDTKKIILDTWLNGSLDLWIKEIDSSVSWNISTTF